MAHVKVPLMGSSNRGVFVDPDATPGAVVGVNLYNPDGTLFDPGTAAPADAPPASGIALDDVQALARGPITVTGSPAEGAFDYGWNGTTSDVPEGARLYFTQARAVDAVGGEFPAGGFEGQALVKASNAGRDFAWGYPSPIDGGTFN